MPDVMRTVGRYEILRELGRGGMALVYLARQTDLDRFVALKELGAFHASDASFAQRFLRESRVAGSLSHPNIVTVHDYFEYDGTPYIAMEYVERGSLRPYIGNMTLAQIGGVLEGLLAGLTNAEQNGIVHRDLKPENLMVTSDGRVKIADFGIAKATTKMQTGAFLTATGTTVGTPTYMAPEQAMAQDIGPWTDLYSVGCMAFEMFTGKVPFHDSDAPMAILLRHVNEPIAPVKTIDSNVDAGISDWIEHLLVKDPKQRTQSAAEAWDDFEEIIIGLLGPRWRRSARLLGQAQAVDTPTPLTPAPFEGTTAGAAASEEFQSFAWGQAETGTPPTPPAAAPGPYTPPPQDLPPGPMGETPAPAAPPEPAASAAPAEPAAPPEGEPQLDEGFVTFGAPAPPPPTDALIPPPAEPAPEEAAAPEPAAPAEPAAAERTTPPPSEAVEPADDFATYVAPPPPRPPTEDPGTDALEGVRERAGEPEPAPPAPPRPEPVAQAPQPAAPPEPEPVAQAPQPAAPPEPEPAPPPEPEPARERVAAAAASPPGADPGATVMPEALRRRPEPEPEREAAAPSRSKAFPIAIAAGVVLALVVGFVAGGSGGGGSTPKPASTGLTGTAAAAGTQVKVPGGWAKLGAAPDVPGLSISAPAAMAPGGRDGGTAVLVGNVQGAADNSTLLARPFIKALGDVPQRSATVQTADGLQAYRYDNLKPQGFDRAVTVYAAPTSAGVATLACLAPEAQARSFAGTCDQIANTMRVSSGKPLPVGPDAGYAGAVTKALGSVEKAERLGAAKIKTAKTPRAQAIAARPVAGAYTKAAKGLAGRKVSPADRSVNAQLVAALRQTGAAYSKLASAAARKSKSGFKKAAGAVSKAHKALSAAQAGLKAAGYDVAT